MIEKVFDHLSKWRNLPNYQLERRADIFFSIYLNDIITLKTGIDDEWIILPEFPVPIKVIYPMVQDNKSVKIDYLVVGPKSNKVIFVELKTDNSSRREKQDWYLVEARDKGLIQLLNGLKDIFKATASKKKYLYLFSILREMGLVDYDNSLETHVRNSRPGIYNSIRSIEVRDNILTRTVPEILYIQPSGSGIDIINFEDISRMILNKYEDQISLTFCKALIDWAAKKAGEI